MTVCSEVITTAPILILYRYVLLAALQKKVRELHARMAQLEGEKYDWEVKLRRQDIEINELTMKVNDVKGKL